MAITSDCLGPLLIIVHMYKNLLGYRRLLERCMPRKTQPLLNYLRSSSSLLSIESHSSHPYSTEAA
jgi:hypothetical protein